MINRIANWYADVGKKIFLIITMVLVIISTVGTPITCFVFAGIFFSDDSAGLGVLMIFVALISIAICLVILGIIKGEMILFDRINTRRVVTITKGDSSNISQVPEAQITKKDPAKEVKANQEPVVKTSVKVPKNIKVGDEVFLVEATRVSPVDPTLIPVDTKCIVKDITPEGVEVSVSLNGRFFVISLLPEKIRK